MAFTLTILIALIGAVALGFICAWYLQKQTMESAISRAIKSSESKYEEKKVAVDKLTVESETQKLSIENLQKQLQSLENELISIQSEVRVMEGENQVLQREKLKLELEKTNLEFELKNNIREIEVIREIPVYVPEENGESKDDPEKMQERIESAKRLVKAFQKGVMENQDKPVVE